MKKILTGVIIIVAVLLAATAIVLKGGESEEIKIPTTNMKITSPAFENNSKIPSKYTCDGESISPPLSFVDVPENAKSLALVVDDPDAPMGTFTHWILFNIDPEVKEVKENSVPQSAFQGKTSANDKKYVGACPPSGIHRYFFKLYALDTMLNFNNPTEDELEENIKGHIIAKSELIGLYSR